MKSDIYFPSLIKERERERKPNFYGAKRAMAAFPPDLPQLLAEVEDYVSTVSLDGQGEKALAKSEETSASETSDLLD